MTTTGDLEGLLSSGKVSGIFLCWVASLDVHTSCMLACTKLLFSSLLLHATVYSIQHNGACATDACMYSMYVDLHAMIVLMTSYKVKTGKQTDISYDSLPRLQA